MQKYQLWIPVCAFVGSFIGAMLLTTSSRQPVNQIANPKAYVESWVRSPDKTLPGVSTPLWTKERWEACVESKECRKAIVHLYVEAAKPLYPTISFDK